MSMAGGNVKPEDLFDSLKTIKKQYDNYHKENTSFNQKFIDRFKHLLTERSEFLDA